MGTELVVTGIRSNGCTLHVIDQDLRVAQIIALPRSTGWISFYDLDEDQLDDIITAPMKGGIQRFRNLGEGSFQPID